MTQFYDKKYPSIDELVTVEHVEVDCAGGIKCELLEYGRISAFMPVTEISRKRVHSVSRQIKLGKNQACFVINVDEKKGYIDVSMKDVKLEDKVECNAKYKNAKLVYDCFNPVVDKNNHNPLTELDYALLIHPLYAEKVDVYRMLRFTPEKFMLTIDQREALMKQHAKLFPIVLKKVTARINVKSNKCQLDDLKAALMAGLSVPNAKIGYISSPTYLVLVEDIDGETALNLVEECLQRIKLMCHKTDCDFSVDAPPSIQVIAV